MNFWVDVILLTLVMVWDLCSDLPISSRRCRGKSSKNKKAKDGCHEGKIP